MVCFVMISCARIMALSCSMGLCTPAIKTHELTALQSFRKLDVASRGRFARLAPRRGELQITCVGWVCPLLSFPHELFFFPSSSLLFSRVKLPPERWIFICVDWIPFSPAAAPYILDTSRVILK
jgi:hypothetical protein